MAKSTPKPSAAPKKRPPAAAAPATDPTAAAPANATDTPPESGTGALAAETTQEHAAAGETQDESGKTGSDPVNALRITSAREGFRRAGRAWSVAPTDVLLADLTDEQIAMLRAEPMLTVEDIVVEAAAE